VPTTGLDSSEVKEEVTELAIAFFGYVLELDNIDDRPFTDFPPVKFKSQPKPVERSRH